MPGEKSPNADWLIMCIITGLLVFITLEACVFAVLGGTGLVSSLGAGSRALTIIAVIAGVSSGASFIYTRRIR